MEMSDKKIEYGDRITSQNSLFRAAQVGSVWRVETKGLVIGPLSICLHTEPEWAVQPRLSGELGRTTCHKSALHVNNNQHAGSKWYFR
jgi:hypothetical protein